MYKLHLVAETWRRIWGTEKLYADQRRLSIFTAENSDDFPYLYYVKCRISPFPLNKKHLFLLCSYFCAHPATLLLKIWGDGCMGRPPTPNFWWDRPPSPHRSPPLVAFKGEKLLPVCSLMLFIPAFY